MAETDALASAIMDQRVLNYLVEGEVLLRVVGQHVVLEDLERHRVVQDVGQLDLHCQRRRNEQTTRPIAV